MSFEKYQHVERLGTSEVEGILEGTCHVFPKIDGTNASVWANDGEHHCGSRRRLVTPESDNAGFAEWYHNGQCQKAQNLNALLTKLPGLHLFGEWLVPHSLKSYREEAWERFYVFDVVHLTVVDDEVVPVYTPYYNYQPILEEFEIDYVPCMTVVENALGYDFNKLLPQNDFMMQEGCQGEGIVIKNYDFKNRFGRVTWAKIVTSEFKEKNQKTMGPTEKTGESLVEMKIADQYVTEALCTKVKAKIEVERGDWSSKYIPRLLNTVYQDVVQEEIWHILKKFKSPTIDFKRLKSAVSIKVKQQLPEVF